MTTRRKALLTILVVVFLVDVGIFRSRSHKSQNHQDQVINSNEDAIESLSREIKDKNSKLDRLIAEADIIIGHLQQLRHLPPPTKPTNGVKSSYHDGGYENVWIQDIDQKVELVLVTAIDSKMTIVFKPAADDLQKFHIGWIAPVTFQCAKINKGKCDFDSPYQLFVSNGLVEVKKLKFPKK